MLLGWPDYTYCFVNTVVLSWLPAVLLILLGSGYSFRYPEGRQWCLRLSSCLEPQGYHLIPLLCLLSRFSAETSCSICLVIFILMPYPLSWLYFPESIRHVFVKRSAFLCGSCWTAGWWLAGCSLLPYGTGSLVYCFPGLGCSVLPYGTGSLVYCFCPRLFYIFSLVW